MSNSSNASTVQGPKHLLVFRLIAGLPLLAFGLLHLINPASFREILVASALPAVEFNLIAAPLAEVAAGILLLSGLYARVGGLLGMATMVVAIYATVVLAGLDPAQLPAGVQAVPEVPPVPIPAAVLLASVYVAWRGSGAWSLQSMGAPIGSSSSAR